MDNSLITVRVADRQVAAQDIVVLELAAAQGGALPAFAPGAHIDLHLPGGLIRQYSLAGDCARTDRYRIAILREPQSRGGSVAAHERIQRDDLLQISPPRNRFPLVPAPGSLLLAGGIGVTPLLCMALKLQADGAAFHLHYSCRTRARAAFLDALAAPALAAHVGLHFDDEPDTQLDLAAELAVAQPGTQLYVCGPLGYIDYVLGQARAAGMPESAIHIERFALDDAERPVPTEQDVAFQVQLASTGEIFDIPADESITSALDRQGVFIPVSCEEGICGTCLTGVVEGIPDHRDTYLTDEEHAANDQFTPCCSRARTPKLVLDL
ncbi:PDR/VanB family oxidoreductase [Castellaniella caeni]|uniref:PDR/VanB family oxidoreductase n=1 Tax=Castellaniella caeni TaxID=266123 RepID=UPI000B281DA5|nr:PDR/VanB family oxidoreductase [Castellaniella caeni]